MRLEACVSIDLLLFACADSRKLHTWRVVTVFCSSVGEDGGGEDAEFGASLLALYNMSMSRRYHSDGGYGAFVVRAFLDCVLLCAGSTLAHSECLCDLIMEFEHYSQCV